MEQSITEVEERRKRRRLSVNWNGFVLVLSMLLLVTFVATTSGTESQLANVQPVLQQMAQSEPQARVSVIVQEGGHTVARSMVPELGGTVTKDLGIIDAFAAELPAGAVTALAQADGVRWVSLDGPIVNSGRPVDPDRSSLPQNYYLDTLNVRPVWEMGLDGSGVGVAIIDSGIQQDRDFDRVEKFMSFNPHSTSTSDVSGHGTHVAGIVAGTGKTSRDIYEGIAPGATLISLKISDETGMAYESDTVAAMQWVLNNKEQYNIRVVNLSINSSAEGSYHNSPLDAAAEILWFNGIVVVTSAGNELDNFNTVRAAPANDPFVITVGASDEHDDAERSLDHIADYSAFGLTVDGHQKPEVIAPGADIVSVLSGQSVWPSLHPDRVVLNGEYFRLSGTSMAAPMVTGAVALLLEDEPGLNPDQVKYRLMHTGSTIFGSGLDVPTGYPYLDVYDLITSVTTETANTGLEASQLLWTGDDPVQWDSVNWASVNWASVNWASVNWASVNWASVNWASVQWDD